VGAAHQYPPPGCLGNSGRRRRENDVRG
jgi:hypothetical protein